MKRPAKAPASDKKENHETEQLLSEMVQLLNKENQKRFKGVGRIFKRKKRKETLPE